MRVLILGSSGIIGQHMRLCVPGHPVDINPIWHRRMADRLHEGAYFEDERSMLELLDSYCPQVVVNLAGENSTDSGGDSAVNVEAVSVLAAWCNFNDAKLIQISSQAVFKGDDPPYQRYSRTVPVNQYGEQKVRAEKIAEAAQKWATLRLTFVLGVRPMPTQGRKNPAESMLDGSQPHQVNDRWFSPLFARDAARLIWRAVVEGWTGVHHLGNPIRVSRYDAAMEFGADPLPARHDDFKGLAPRPVDTTYADGAHWLSEFSAGCRQVRRDFEERESLGVEQRAREIALFFNWPESRAAAELLKGFRHHHDMVARDFKATNPLCDVDLLGWYGRTERYIWELSAYHCDPGFNYMGMCSGIAERLKAENRSRVLVLGDGIGDLSLTLKRAGLNPVYHDLAGSRTADFADFRFWLYADEPIEKRLTITWEPDIGGDYDAVVALDFLEHVPDVPQWTEAIRAALVPGGLFFAQNAFGLGSGPDGSIPCHLAENDRFEKDWAPLMGELRFQQVGASNWWKAA